MKVLIGLLIVLAATLALGAAAGSLEDVWRLLQEVNLYLLGAGFIAFAAASAFRAFRFHGLVGKGVSFVRVLGVTVSHQVYRTVAPANLGEVSYPILLRRAGGPRHGVGFGQLLLVRLLDVVSLVGVMGLGMILAGQSPPAGAWTKVVGLGAVAVCLVGLLSAPCLLRQSAAMALKLSPNRLRGKGRVLARSALSARGVFTKLMRAPRNAGPVLGVTVFIMLAGWFRMQFTMEAVLGSIPLANGLLVFSLAQLLGALPIKVGGGFGAREGGVLAILVAMDYSVESAAAATAVLALTVPVFPLALWLPFRVWAAVASRTV